MVFFVLVPFFKNTVKYKSMFVNVTGQVQKLRIVWQSTAVCIQIGNELNCPATVQANNLRFSFVPMKNP